AVQGGVDRNYATHNGSATTGDSDYTATSGTLTFSGAAGTQTITVHTGTDTKVEADEDMTVSLDSINAAAGVRGIGGTTPGTLTSVGSPATGTIFNDDSATVTISNASVDEGGDLKFEVVLSAAVQGGVTVPYSTHNGSATTGDSNYTATSGTLTFSRTAGTQTLTPYTTLFRSVEADEDMTVSLDSI